MSFVGPVVYDRRAIFERHKVAVDAAASIFLAACEAHSGLIADKSVGLPFMRRMANELIASRLIWNCITSKHIGYEHDREVRLVLMGQTSKLSPYVKTRIRGSEAVRYVPHPFRIREPGAIQEIVVGPSAMANAEDRVRDTLMAMGLKKENVTVTDINGVVYAGRPGMDGRTACARGYSAPVTRECRRSSARPCPLHATAAAITITAPVVHILRRVGRVWGSGLARGRLGAPSERQDDEEGGKPSLPVHQFSPLPIMVKNLPRQRPMVALH